LKIRNYIWIVLGLVALIVNWLFGVFPSLYEWVYFRTIFQGLRMLYDFLLGWIPFPMVYILFLGVVQIIYKFIQFKDFRSAKDIPQKILAIVLPILSLAGAVIFFFYFLWGFNYKQKNLSEQLNFPEVKADTSELYNEATFFLQKMDKLRNELSTDTSALSFDQLPDGYEGEIREKLESLLQSWDIPTLGRVRVRSLYPKGTLLRISTAGVYIPYVFEGHIDAGLHPIQFPFTMAHEMSHGYGLADEGTCNFTGFLACLMSEDPFIQYSACMSFWRYMASNLRSGSPRMYRQLMKEIPPLVRKDLISVMDEMDKYPDVFPKVRNAVYDSYLKSHGVASGLSSYSTVVRMVMEWKESGYNEELKASIFKQ